jgi:hypothetical protein
MSKEAVERLRQRAQNEATYFAMRDLCNDQQKEIDSLRQTVATLNESLTITSQGNARLKEQLAASRQRIARYVAGVLQTGTSAGDAWLTSGQFPLLDPADAIGGDGITMELTATSGTPTGLAVYTRGY